MTREEMSKELRHVEHGDTKQQRAMSKETRFETADYLDALPTDGALALRRIEDAKQGLRLALEVEPDVVSAEMDDGNYWVPEEAWLGWRDAIKQELGT